MLKERKKNGNQITTKIFSKRKPISQGGGNCCCRIELRAKPNFKRNVRGCGKLRQSFFFGLNGYCVHSMAIVMSTAEQDPRTSVNGEIIVIISAPSKLSYTH